MKLGYQPELDGIRALAALSVVACHAMPAALMGGGLGVDVFFVLSGFLITTLLRAELEATGRIDWRGFMLRRVRRLYPALLFMLAGFLLAAPIYWPGTQWEVIPAALYVTNLFRCFDLVHTVSHTWSLGVEVQFYLLWPLLLPAIIRGGRPVLVLALAWVALTAARVGLGELAGFNLRCSGLVLGALVAFLPRAPGIWAAVGLGLIALSMSVLFTAPAPLLFAFSGAEIGAALMVSAAAASGRPLVWPPLVYLGQISYGLYLWHAPIANALHHFPLLNGQVLVLTLGLSLLMAWVSWTLIEQPISRGHWPRVLAPHR